MMTVHKYVAYFNILFSKHINTTIDFKRCSPFVAVVCEFIKVFRSVECLVVDIFLLVESVHATRTLLGCLLPILVAVV